MEATGQRCPMQRFMLTDCAARWAQKGAIWGDWGKVGDLPSAGVGQCTLVGFDDDGIL